VRPINPLVTETWQGLLLSGEAQVTYLGYLAAQALALIAWWPWGEIHRLLDTRAEPKTLVAVVIALGVTVSLYAIRAGGQEILLPGQRSLMEWVAATSLTVARILAGYLGAHLLQTLHLLMLSSPLLMAGFAVAGGTWASFAWCIAAVLVMATCYRLVGAIIFLLVEQDSPLIFVALRGVLIGSYAIAPFVCPAASQPMLSYYLLSEDASTHLALAGLQGHWVFVGVYGALSGLLAVVLYRLLSRKRRGLDGSHERRVAKESN